MTNPAEPTSGATAGSARRALVAAGLVLALWFAWLLVPDQARQDLLAGTAPATGAGPVGTSAAEPDEPEPDEPEPDDDVSAGDSPRAGATGPAPASTPDAEAPGGGARAAEPTPDEAPLAETGPSAAPVVVVPAAGDGVFAVAPGGSQLVGEGEVVTYTVEVEGGIGLDPVEVSAVVDDILADPRSWTAQGRWAYQRVDVEPDARILLASPDTTDALCLPLDTEGRYSCRNGQDVVLNAVRWTEGADTWGEDVEGYRGYLVNHEFGHFLGNGHVGCPGPGQLAPVMMQQTIAVDGCLPSAWPYP